MDGFADPSLPTLPSVVNALKEMPAPTGGATYSGDRKKSSLDQNEEVLMGLTSEKKKFSFSKPAPHKSNTDQSQFSVGDDAMKKTPMYFKVRLSAKQQQDIADAFNAFDVHGTGYMSTTDLRVALKALGFEARKEEMKKILEKWDKNYTGRLCYADFMNIIEEKLGEDDSREDLLKAFKLFDKDQIGRIAFHNLKQVATELQEDVNDEELAEMLAEADLDDDGTINEDEFIKILKKSSMTSLY